MQAGGVFRQQNVAPPEEVMPHVIEAVSQDHPVAMLFGPESTGLTNDIVTRCHYLIEIPTADRYSSLNLAQAVAICVYELHKSSLTGEVPTEPPLARPAREQRLRNRAQRWASAHLDLLASRS